MLFSAVSLVLAFLLMLSNYLLFIGWVYTIFNSCTCISMSSHTAIIITLQRLLCYLLHAFCFSPLISPDFARRGCPELNMKVQVQQQKTWKKAEGLYRPILHWSFKRNQNLSICCTQVYSAVDYYLRALWSMSAALCSGVLTDRLLALYFPELAVQSI